MLTLSQENSQDVLTNLRGTTMATPRNLSDETSDEDEKDGGVQKEIRSQMQPLAKDKDQATVPRYEASSLEERVVTLEKLVSLLGEELHNFRYFVESMIGRMGGDAPSS